ncbi:MAG: hypothetical protein QOI85_320 [Chloroflexota bacterium]|jgi:hypothetical protein|nr:hypothetical protein [Chloroflexota bacterium]
MRASRRTAYNPSPMTSRRPLRAASAAGARGRGHHTLAPAHLGEATAAATVGVVVGGVALVITGVGILAMALTIGSRYGGDPPPNAGALSLAPALLGVATLVLGGGLTAGGLAVFADVRRSRLLTGILSGVAAALAAAAALLVMAKPPPDVVLAIALTAATVVFGVAAILLLRPRR